MYDKYDWKQIRLEPFGRRSGVECNIGQSCSSVWPGQIFGAERDQGDQ